MLGCSDDTITPNRGEYYLLDKSEGSRVKSVIFQCPNEQGKGVLVAPTVHGNLIVGPNAVPTDDPDGTENMARGMRFVREMALRVFVIDSMALEKLSRERIQAEPDALEILPGVMPEVLRQVCTQVTVPVIAGGLLSRKSDVMAALNAGAAAVSMTSECLWEE